MIAQKLTCPQCGAVVSLRHRRGDGRRASCPRCDHPILADLPPVIAPPPLPTRSRSVLCRELVLALAGALALAAGGIVAALVLTRERPSPVVRDPAVKPAPADEERRRVEAERKALAEEKKKVAVARLLAKASLAQAQARFAEAEKLYGEVLKLAPEESEAVDGLVAVKVALEGDTRGRQEKAARDAEYGRLMAQGKEALAKKQYAVAASSFTAAGQARPGDPEAAIAVAEVGKAQAAEENTKRQLAEYQAHLDAGKAAAAARRYADAVQAFLAGQRLNASDEVAALLKDARGRLDEQQDREKRRAQFAGLMERAQFALRNRRYDAAVEAGEAALKLFPEDREAKELVQKANKAKKDTRAEFTRLMAQGNSALQNQQIEQAARAFAAASALVPDDPTASRMVKQLDQMLQNLGTGPAAYLRSVTQGGLALRAGLYGDAVRAYTEALRIAPADPEALLGLREAQANLAGAVVLGADYDRLVTGGAQLLRQRQWHDAARAFRDALRLAPADPTALAGLRQARYQSAMANGQAAITARRYADAVRFFQEALVEAPGDVPATAALRQVQMLRR